MWAATAKNWESRPRFPPVNELRLYHVPVSRTFEESQLSKPANEVVLYEENPSMFRNQPVAFVINCLLCLIGVGLIIFLIWWLKCKGTTLTVTNERTRLRKGILSKSVTEVWHEDIRNVQLNQTFFQRIFDVGSIGISSAGQSGLEISVSGMPNPEHIKELIDGNRRR